MPCLCGVWRFANAYYSPKGRKEAELAAAMYQANNQRQLLSAEPPINLTLTEAIDRYLDSSDNVLSPSTVHGYRIIQRNGFKNLMNIRINDITQEMLQTAVNHEASLIVKGHKISPKTVHNRYGLISAVLNRYRPELSAHIRLPQVETKIMTLPEPESIMKAFKGDRLELAVLLAMWMSFSMSEIRGLSKSKSIDGDYIVIREVRVQLSSGDIVKPQGKVSTRNRMHRIPAYIKSLIDQVDGDIIVPYSAHAIYCHFRTVLRQNNIPHISFHGLRHLNASVMAKLNIPEKYAMERGGWKTDTVMKRVYTHTFSNERIKVDNIIDEYFETMQHEMQHE